MDQSIPPIDVRGTWLEMPFHGSAIEERLIGKWPWLILAMCPPLVWARWESPHGWLDPFMITLVVGLVLCACSFEYWKTKMVRTMSNVVELGVVAASDAGSFVASSRGLATRLKGRRRLICVALGVVAGLAPGVVVLLTSKMNTLQLAYSLAFAGMGYCIGSGVWALISVTGWLRELASGSLLRIQVGHADGCCGFQELGNCSLRATLPVLWGMLLALTWANSNHLALLRNYDPTFLPFIVPFALTFSVALAVLSIGIVVVPFWRLHQRLDDFKRTKQLQYSLALEAEVSTIAKVIDGNDANLAKSTADRLKLLQQMDPAALKLASWPFDQQSLVKYAATPTISLLGTIGKKIYEAAT